MAVVKLGKAVKAGGDGSVNGMGRVIRYVIDPAKTDGGRLVSSNYETAGADADRLADAMLDDLKATPMGIQGGSKASRLAYHVKFSFAPDDPITPDRVHELGVELAERITGGDHKYIVATHTDRHHLHNHIVICAASQTTGSKWQLPKDVIDQWREIADEICRREGLSVIEPEISIDERSQTTTARTTPPADPGTAERTGKTPEPQAGKTTEGTREPRRERHGFSMAELYTTMRGVGVKDRIRTLVDMCAANSEGFEDMSRMLGASGVKVESRGRHLTFTWKKTGFRIRDSKLGPAYTQANIMARIGRERMLPITFNRRLVARKTKQAVTVWLPGTKRRLRITIPRRYVTATGGTWRAWLPESRVQNVTDRRGRYAKRVTTEGLYQWFGRPEERVEPLTRPDRLGVVAGRTEGQQRYYAMVAAKVDRLHDAAAALNAAARWTRAAGGDGNDGVRLLQTQVEESRTILRSTVIALSDAIENGDHDLAIETRQEMERREAELDHFEGELSSLSRAAGRTADKTADDRRKADGTRRNRRGRSL